MQPFFREEFPSVCEMDMCVQFAQGPVFSLSALYFDDICTSFEWRPFSERRSSHSFSHHAYALLAVHFSISMFAKVLAWELCIFSANAPNAWLLHREKIRCIVDWQDFSRHTSSITISIRFSCLNNLWHFPYKRFIFWQQENAKFFLCLCLWKYIHQARALWAMQKHDCRIVLEPSRLHFHADKVCQGSRHKMKAKIK